MANPVVSMILKKLDEFLSQEINLLARVKPQLKSLQREFRIISASLKDFDMNRAQVSNQMEELVKELREVAFEAEDIIDDFYLMIDQKKRSGIRGSLMSFLVCVGETSARHELGTRIEDTRRRIDEIHKNMGTYGINLKPVDESPPSSSVARGTSELDKAALSQGLSVVGFAEAERSMREQLLNGKGKLAVISVVGMGGIGKTTIAKKIYSDDAVDGHFGYRAWVTVSQKFTPIVLLQNTLRSILDCISGTRREKEEIGSLTDMQLVEKLKARLKKVRYLVVIDDIWEKKAWDLINSALPPFPGSRVMLTTRIEAVARYAQGEIYKLPFLSEEESWELFCAKVFPGGEACPPELEEVGKEMVRRCRGLPLAIVVLGGLLIEKETRRYEWEVLCRRLTEKLSADRNEMIKNILALSYDDLSDDLKICFLYIGLFPEDMEIDATKLVQLWVAEGFIVQARGLTLEETAEQHLEQLANRSVLQVVDRDPLGRVDKCRIHDLLLDLAKDEGGKNQFVDVHEGLTPTHAVRSRRLAVHENASFCLASSSCLVLNLRSLLCFNLRGQELSDSFAKLRSLKFLRVIDIEGAPIELLPKEIGSMVHLTYLGFRRTKLASLPSSIEKLRKLQTLDVRDVPEITLPQGIWRMKTLRHLHVDRAQPQASSCGTLTELQTLHTAVAGAWVKAGLRKLSNIRKLTIVGVSEAHVEPLSEAIQRKLKCLNLLKLEGSFVPNVLGLDLRSHSGLHQLILKGSTRNVDGLVAGNLPQNITAITLQGCGLAQDPLALLEKLPYLVNLRLFRGAFAGDEMVCSAAGFPRLRELCLSELEGLRRLRVAEGAMGSLLSFAISRCPLLESLPGGMKGMRALKELKLEGMPEAFTERAEVDGADWPQIRHIPLVKVL